jgi:hypothetical protein
MVKEFTRGICAPHAGFGQRAVRAQSQASTGKEIGDSKEEIEW